MLPQYRLLYPVSTRAWGCLIRALADRARAQSHHPEVFSSKYSMHNHEIAQRVSLVLNRTCHEDVNYCTLSCVALFSGTVTLWAEGPDGRLKCIVTY